MRRWANAGSLSTMIRKGNAVLHIKKSPTADSRTCDFAKVSKEQLLESSRQHIEDVRKAMEFFEIMLSLQAHKHDHDKIHDIDGFHADFWTGFKTRDWWGRHKKINRHHLTDHVPLNVNLIDVLEYIADCVMAGMARKGSVYEIQIEPEVLARAFDNTADLLRSMVVVDEDDDDVGAISGGADSLVSSEHSAGC